jgi:hypothetical protein
MTTRAMDAEISTRMRFLEQHLAWAAAEARRRIE